MLLSNRHETAVDRSKLLKRLSYLWDNLPDLRLGQLLVNLKSKYNDKAPDIFYVEDYEFERYVEAWIKELGLEDK